MSDDNLKKLIGYGLSAMQAGSAIAAKATDEIGNAASHPALKERLERGNHVSKQWAERIDGSLQQLGSGGPQENPILQALYMKTRETIEQASDARSRDLGIVACGQIGLHYWITTFSTAANYAKHLGMEDIARNMKASSDEAKQADEQLTAVAEDLLHG